MLTMNGRRLSTPQRVSHIVVPKVSVRRLTQSASHKPRHNAAFIRRYYFQYPHRND